MPSPFPGMDPYLEHPEFFPGLHGSLIFCLKEVLQGSLPEPYFADTGARVWVEYTERIVEPDVNVMRGDAPSRVESPESGAAAGVSVRPVVVYVPQDEFTEEFLEIRTIQGDQHLVTSIEVLSLSNKLENSEGRRLYIKKQREMLGSQVNLVEIDLLRGGTHTTAVRREDAIAAAGSFDYHVCVRSFDELQRGHVYPIRLDQSLPEILIPLLPGDPGVKVDLKAIFDRCYDAGPYRRRVPYRQRVPVPSLTPEQFAWAELLLRERGLWSPPSTEAAN
jgi:Protein of unknown function (DUF4058)